MSTSTEQRKTLSSLLDKALVTADAVTQLHRSETQTAKLEEEDVLSKVLKDICEVCEVCEGVTAVAERVLRNSSHRSSSLLVGKAKDKAMTCDDFLRKIEDWRSTSTVPNTKMGNISSPTTSKRKVSNTDIPSILGPKRIKSNATSNNALHIGRDDLNVATRKSKNEIEALEMSSKSKMKSRTVVPNYLFPEKKSAKENTFNKALKAKLEFAKREAELAEEAERSADSNVGITRCARCKNRYERAENSDGECIWHPGETISVGENVYNMWSCCGNSLKKGDVLSVARIVGIIAAKKCSDLIPLYHPVAITSVEIDVEPFGGGRGAGDEAGNSDENKGEREVQSTSWAGTGQGDAYEWRTVKSDESTVKGDKDFGRVETRATVACDGKTGVKMEALTAASVAALTVYDMCKAVGKGMRIEGLRVVRKEGGKNGT